MSEQKLKEEMEDLARHVKRLHTIALLVGVPAFDAWALINDAFVHTCERKKPLPVESDARKAVFLKIFRFLLRRYFSERNRMYSRAKLAHEYATVIAMTYARDSSEVLEAREVVEMVIRPLTPEQLDVITEKALDELTIREVAERLGIKENTAQSHWQRGCTKIALEMEKLDQPKLGKVRSVLVFVTISSIITAARNARAMFGALRRFFRSVLEFASIPRRAVTGMATVASIVLLGPGQSGAHANKPIRAEEHAVPTPAQSASAPQSEKPKTALANAVPSVKPPLPSRIVAKSCAQKSTDLSLDALVSMAKMALRRGDAQRALALLEQINLANAPQADVAMVNALKSAAKMALAAKVTPAP